MDQLALFGATVGAVPPRPPSPKDRAMSALEAKHRDYLDRLRAALREEFRKVQRPLSADDAHRLIGERKDLRWPGDMSSMAIGGLFKNDRDEEGRPRWELMGLVKSTRENAHDNLLRSWACIR